MLATDILSSEHRVIERVLNSLETATNRLAAGKAVRPGFFLDAASFIQGFADGCHHKKEEGVLFPTLVETNRALEAGPVGVMLREHDEGRRFTRGMREAATRLDAGDLSAKDGVVANARAYVALLRAHIAKEDGVLFPMATRVIPADRQDSLVEAFERVEHEETGEGIHEKYLGLAEKLETEIRSPAV